MLRPLSLTEIHKLPAGSAEIAKLLLQNHNLRDAIRQGRAELIYASFMIANDYGDDENDPAGKCKKILKELYTKRENWRGIPAACAVCSVVRRCAPKQCEHINSQCEWCAGETPPPGFQAYQGSDSVLSIWAGWN